MWKEFQEQTRFASHIVHTNCVAAHIKFEPNQIVHINTKSKYCEHIEDSFPWRVCLYLTEIKPLFVYLVVCLEFVVQTVEQRFEEEFQMTGVCLIGIPTLDKIPGTS